MKRLISFAIMMTISFICSFPILAQAKQTEIPTLQVQGQFEDNFQNGITTKWLYFDGLLTPKQVKVNSEQGTIIQTPILVDNLNGTTSGKGTFAIYLNIPRENVGKMLEIHIPSIYKATNVYLNNKLMISKNNKHGLNQQHMEDFSSDVLFFRPDQINILLTVQIVDYSLLKESVIEPLYIGVADHGMNSWNKDFFWNCLLVGCNLMIGLFFISIGMYKSYGRDILLFGFFCVAIAIRAFFGVPYIYAIIMPDFSWSFAFRMEYLFTCIATFFFIWLIYTVADGEFSKKMFKITNGLLLISVMFILFTPANIYQPTFFALYVWAVPMLVYVVYILIKSIFLKNKLALGHAIGILFVFLAVLSDYASGLVLVHMPPLVLVGTTGYVLIQMIFLSRQFSTEVSNRLQLNKELIESNRNLDEKIYVRTKELEEANKQLQNIANKDGLTGIFNRHYFNEYMTREFNEGLVTHKPLAMLIIDVDDFKKYNDTYGHIAGDILLENLAKKMNGVVPESGMLARYGGEEFAVVLPNTTKEAAILLGHNIQKAIEEEQMPHRGTDKGIITVSIGGATFECSTIYKTVNDFIDAADQNLYKGKNQGKNIVVFNDV
ncbi:MAG: diguanylate cyclase [Kurthia sp.]|nr:diguanylate cyclase [Candidatus Kurthia equi]